MGTKPNTLTERADKVRINGRRPSDLQYEGLNTPIMHETKNLAVTQAIWIRGGSFLLGQLAAKSEGTLKGILRAAYLAKDADDNKGAKRTLEERQKLTSSVERDVAIGMAELLAVLHRYDLKPGMRIEHWENLSHVDIVD